MKNFIVFVSVLLIHTFIYSQNTKQITLKPFSTLVVFGSFDVDIEPGDTESLNLESAEADLSKVSIVQEGEVLKIKATQNLFANKTKVNVKLFFKHLYVIKANGGAHITAIKPLEKENLELVAQNGAYLTIPVQSESINAVSGQGSTISIQGNCNNLEVIANNGGLFDAYELKSANILAKARTGSIIKINPVKKLEAHVFANGQISYRGTPQLKVNQIFGGSVEKVTE